MFQGQYFPARFDPALHDTPRSLWNAFSENESKMCPQSGWVRSTPGIKLTCQLLSVPIMSHITHNLRRNVPRVSEFSKTRFFPRSDAYYTSGHITLTGPPLQRQNLLLKGGVQLACHRILPCQNFRMWIEKGGPVHLAWYPQTEENVHEKTPLDVDWLFHGVKKKVET